MFVYNIIDVGLYCLSEARPKRPIVQTCQYWRRRLSPSKREVPFPVFLQVFRFNLLYITMLKSVFVKNGTLYEVKTFLCHLTSQNSTAFCWRGLYEINGSIQVSMTSNHIQGILKFKSAHAE